MLVDTFPFALFYLYLQSTPPALQNKRCLHSRGWNWWRLLELFIQQGRICLLTVQRACWQGETQGVPQKHASPVCVHFWPNNAKHSLYSRNPETTVTCDYCCSSRKRSWFAMCVLQNVLYTVQLWFSLQLIFHHRSFLKVTEKALLLLCCESNDLSDLRTVKCSRKVSSKSLSAALPFQSALLPFPPLILPTALSLLKSLKRQ